MSEQLVGKARSHGGPRRSQRSRRPNVPFVFDPTDADFAKDPPCPTTTAAAATSTSTSTLLRPSTPPDGKRIPRKPKRTTQPCRGESHLSLLPCATTTRTLQGPLARAQATQQRGLEYSSQKTHHGGRTFQGRTTRWNNAHSSWMGSDPQPPKLQKAVQDRRSRTSRRRRHGNGDGTTTNTTSTSAVPLRHASEQDHGKIKRVAQSLREAGARAMSYSTAIFSPHDHHKAEESSTRRTWSTFSTVEQEQTHVVDLCGEDDSQATVSQVDDQEARTIPSARRGVNTNDERQHVAEPPTSGRGSAGTSRDTRTAAAVRQPYSLWETVDRSTLRDGSKKSESTLAAFQNDTPSSSPEYDPNDSICRTVDPGSVEAFDAALDYESERKRQRTRPSPGSSSDRGALPSAFAKIGTGLAENPVRTKDPVRPLSIHRYPPSRTKKPGIKIVPGSSLTEKSELPDDPIIDFQDGESNKRTRAQSPNCLETTPSKGRSTGMSPRRFHAAPNKRQTRSSSRVEKAVHSRFTASKAQRDSEMEWQFDDDYEYSSSKPRNAKWHTVARISIGKKVFSRKCMFRLTSVKKTSIIELSFENGNSIKSKHQICLTDDSVCEMKYFLPDDESEQAGNASALVVIDGDDDDMAFLSMRIMPNEANGFTKYSNSYDGAKANAHPLRKFVTVEFRSAEEFRAILLKLRENDQLCAFMAESAKLAVDKIPLYAHALVKDSDLEKENRIGSPRKLRSTRGRNKGKVSNKVLLVYPFDGDQEAMDAAASGLAEAGLLPLHSESAEKTKSRIAAINHDDSDDIMECDPVSGSGLEESEMAVDSAGEGDIEMGDTEQNAVLVRDAMECDLPMDDSTSPTVPNSSGKAMPQTPGQERSEHGYNEIDASRVSEKEESKVAKSGHRHYVTITEEDRERCDPTVYLNDSLVDFWMQWLWRKEDRSTSPLHIFSSHFYTTLSEGNGLSAVTTWTAKRNIDVFTKRFVFIPVNKELHWSLCVVVNPGAIVHDVNDDFDECSPKACILFLDSLKAHRMNEVARQVHRWLNSEWKRLGKSSHVDMAPFALKTMPVFAPTIPYQENGWDCGVFVCRYAYSLYQRRLKDITYGDVLDRFQGAITNAPEFQFGMTDIARVRMELGELVDRLSAIYMVHKEKIRQEEEEEEEINENKKPAPEEPTEVRRDETKGSAQETSHTSSTAKDSSASADIESRHHVCETTFGSYLNNDSWNVGADGQTKNEQEEWV